MDIVPEFSKMSGVENKHVVAESVKDAKQKLFQDEEFKRLKMHINGLQEVNIVDGYKISATKVEYQEENNPTYSHCDVKKLGI